MSNQLKIVSKMRMEKGSLKYKDNAEKQKFDAQLTFFPDCELRMTLERWDEKREKEFLRTQNQNRYYHKLLDIICDYTGDTHLDLHDKFKVKFLGRPYVLDDKEYIIVPSTTELNSKNFGEYLEKIFAFVGEEYELILPSPSDYY